MIKYLLLFLITGTSFQIHAQSRKEKRITHAVEELRKGILNADNKILQNITANELIYSHSSGKVQTKEEFIDEIISGKPLDYITIQLSDQIIRISGNTAIVRHTFRRKYQTIILQ